MTESVTSPPPGTIVVFSDLACPFTHIAVHRLFRSRARLGLEDAVHFDHHSFPIELLNAAPGTRHGSDSEIPALGHLEPDAGWQLWQGAEYHYPSTVLHAFEAVHAAKLQGARQSEDLDRALRRAFWAESATIQLHSTVVDIARKVDGLDADVLARHLAEGVGRKEVFDDLAVSRTDAVSMSPHLFLPDGTEYTNPGMAVRWQGDFGKGFPVVDGDDPSVYHEIVRAAAP